MNDYVKQINITKNSIHVLPGEALNKYIKEEFYAVYEKAPDLSDLDESIALIPFILATVQIIWCTNQKVKIERLDKNFNRSLKHLKDEYKKIYPNIDWNGEIIVENENITDLTH